MNKDKSTVIERMLHTSGALQIREREDGKESRTISGYAILFNTPSAVLYSWGNEDEREVINPAAISRDLLDSSDIKMTMFHDRQLILARSNKGAGTLSYKIDEKGVYFEFEAPRTVDGDKALELVKRGDLAGCSFAFTTHYYNEDYVKPVTTVENERMLTTFYVNRILGVHDFTIAADPAYPDTTVEAREKALFESLRKREEPTPAPEPETPKTNEKMLAQVAEMKAKAAFNLV